MGAMRWTRLFGAVGVAATLSACGGSTTPSASSPATSSTQPSALACGPTPSGDRFPANVPADLPKPPGAHVLSSTTTPDGVRIVRFMTPTSLRQSVIFVVEQLPKAGYVLGRGDAEANEADAPFVHGNLRGLMRMIVAGDCKTEWLLALADVSSGVPGTSPLLKPHLSNSPSPLPFG